MVFDGALCWPRFDTFLDQGFILPNRTQANGDKFLGALVDLDCDAISDEAELRCKPYTQHPSVSRHIRNAPHMATLSQLVLSLSTRKARALETLALAYCFPFATERETLALLSRGRVSPTARGFWKISSVTLGKKVGPTEKKETPNTKLVSRRGRPFESPFAACGSDCGQGVLRSRLYQHTIETSSF